MYIQVSQYKSKYKFHNTERHKTYFYSIIPCTKNCIKNFLFYPIVSFNNVRAKHVKFPGINTLFSSLLIPLAYVCGVCNDKGKTV